MKENQILLYLHEKTGKIADIKMEMRSKYDFKIVEIRGNNKKVILAACKQAFDLGAHSVRREIRELIGAGVPRA